jgi:hypothetical protein
MSFATLGLHEALLKAVADSGYDSATDVQTQAIPAAIAGKDLMVSAAARPHRSSCPRCKASSRRAATTRSGAKRASSTARACWC